MDSLIAHASAGLQASNVNSDALSEVLKLPQPTARTRRKRKLGLNSKATALTDDPLLAAIKEKEAQKVQKETDKHAKKKEWEQRRKEREEAKELRKKELEAKQCRKKALEKSDTKVTKHKKTKKQDQSISTSTVDLVGDLSSALNQCFLSDSDESDSESDAECPICLLTFLGDDSGSAWVCCDSRQTWMDFKCTGLKNPKRIPKQYLCSRCKV